jgi:hypothetical protein
MGEYSLFLSGLGEGLVVGLGERADFTLLAILFVESSNCQSNPHTMETREFTNLPLGETEVHLAAALGGETGAFLEGTAHGACGDGQVTVVAVGGVSIAI